MNNKNWTGAMPPVEKIHEPIIHRGLSSSEYHGFKGTWSSSQLKDLCEDGNEELFHAKWIAKTKEKESIPAFDIGTYFHTSLLEPDKIQTDCAVFTGIRRGKAWENFQVEHAGKAIITETELKQAQGLVESVRKSPVSMGRLEKGEAEVSAFVPIWISGSTIHSHDGRILTPNGWSQNAGHKVPKGAFKLVVKVRADKICDEFILDLKSTTGNAKSEYAMREKVSKYKYDLSAALYLDMFSVATERLISDFIWIFASKDSYNCRTWIADTKNILIGRKKYIKALIALAHNLENDWEIEDSIGILEPSYWELELIKEKGIEYL